MNQWNDDVLKEDLSSRFKTSCLVESEASVASESRENHSSKQTEKRSKSHPLSRYILASYSSATHVVPAFKMSQSQTMESLVYRKIIEAFNDADMILLCNDSRTVLDRLLINSLKSILNPENCNHFRILLSHLKETIADSMGWHKSIRQYANDTFLVKPLSTTHLVLCTDVLLSDNEYSLLQSQFNTLKQSRLTLKHNRITVDSNGKGDLVDPSMYPLYFGHTFYRKSDSGLTVATKPSTTKAEKTDDFQWIPADISVSASDGRVTFVSDINNLPSFGNYQSPLYSSISLIISKMVPQFELILNGRLLVLPSHHLPYDCCATF